MKRVLIPLICLILAVPLNGARQPLRAKRGMVVAMEATAADIGVAVLKAGGNAVDAAVAVGFAMAVTHPFAGNIGGGGYLLIRMADGRPTSPDFRGRAPEKDPRAPSAGPAPRGRSRRPAARPGRSGMAACQTGRRATPAPAAWTGVRGRRHRAGPVRDRAGL